MKGKIFVFYFPKSHLLYLKVIAFSIRKTLFFATGFFVKKCILFMEEMVFLQVREVRPDRRRIRSNSIIRSARSSTEYTICYIFYRLKYHIRTEVLLHILETHEFDDLRSDKECDDDHDQSDHGIADRVDRGFHFLIFAS